MKHLFAANLFKVIAGTVLLGGISGCSVFDPAEEIPSYLHINSMSVNAGGNFGSNSSYITDAWVYMDGDLIGAYELPCTLPILAEGTHHFIIRGGVKMNGVGSTHAIYPFYKGFEGDVTLTRAQSTTLTPDPVLTYFPGADLVTLGDFTSASIITSDAAYLSQMRIDTSSAAGMEGNFGSVTLNDSDTTHFVGRTSAYSLSAAGEVWLELNYKCNENFSVGIVGNQNDFHEWVVVEPSETWNKIYIRLTDVIANTPSTSPYQIYFAMHQQTVSQPYLYLDNIKILR